MVIFEKLSDVFHNMHIMNEPMLVNYIYKHFKTTDYQLKKNNHVLYYIKENNK